MPKIKFTYLDDSGYTLEMNIKFFAVCGFRINDPYPKTGVIYARYNVFTESFRKNSFVTTKRKNFNTLQHI